MINYDRHRRKIEKLYTDRATIYRYQKVKDPVTKETKLVPMPVHSDQPCRISQKALAQNGQTEAQNDIRYETKLFIAPELEILQGDMLEATRGRITATGWEPIAPTRKYTAGEPFIYPTHQEVSIERKEWA
ncbi:ABC transporter ATP-binding protein [Paenibacillus macerans]|uniref:ABC transporter ATP-binding protein n=1 Tax=Paenibacillus macerans TaxID=44252 RepID=UPI00204179C4|nr:ABC transporter ATP-binding protein [Paenibacillus macerans]MCM3701433.1 ABC transporter ATP-binding protein [Paenibacillus macerans]